MTQAAVITRKDANKVSRGSAQLITLIQVKKETPYTVVIQFRNRQRSYIKCETMAKVREAIVHYRKDSKCTYIYYNIPGEEHIEAYDVRDPERYV